MELNLSKVVLSDHAYERAVSRLSLQWTEFSSVNKYIRNQLANADYIGVTTANDGNMCHMFINRGIALYLDKSLETVVTINKFDKIPQNMLQDKIKNLFQKEFRKLDRSEKAKLKQLGLQKYEIELEIAELKLKEYKSKSESLKLACKGRIKALEIAINDFQEDIVKIKAEKRRIANAMVCVW